MKVFVISEDNKPMMPTSPAKARKLLRSGRASVVNKQPFVIRLNFATGNEYQPIICGVDDGAKTAGVSIVQQRTKKTDVIAFSGEIDVDATLVKNRMESRRSYRRTRRYRLRYRKARFDNRVRVKCHVCGRNAATGSQTCREHKGAKPSEKALRNFWMSPSGKSRKDKIVRTLRRLLRWLPFDAAIVETGKFDLQKLANPDLTVDEYQQGPMYGRDSIKAALIAEYGAKKLVDGRPVHVPRCCYCGKEGVSVEIEHIYPRSKGGTDAWQNLTLACKPCNDRKGARTPDEAGMKLLVKPRAFHLSGVFRYAAQMQQGKHYLANELRKIGLAVSFTYGQFTSWTRKRYNVEKSHANDAAVIASTTYDSANPPRVPTATKDMREWAIKPTSTKQRQRFNASNYSPRAGVPKGFSEHATVNFGHTLKTLCEVNQACVVSVGSRGKAESRAIKTGEPIPDGAALIIRKNDVVEVMRKPRGASAEQPFVGRVSSILSNGNIKIIPANSREQVAVSPKKARVLERAQSIVFQTKGGVERG